ncbi:MAG: adenylyl-sulfate kinase [Desulfovibrionaceae bacterium]
MSFTLWFTGLSGSGKTTLANAIHLELRCRGLRVALLDGDIVRRNISRGLSFSRADRNANVRRIGFICHLLNRNGVIGIVAAIAPYTESRDNNRALLNQYVEIFCDSPVEVCEARDVKGLYARARRGEIEAFTGVSDPYYPPERPELHISTSAQTVDESVSTIVRYLEETGLATMERVVAPETVLAEEKAWRERLYALGYLANGK